MAKLSNQLLRSIFNIFFPAFCISCQEILPEKRYIICPSCYSRLDRINEDDKHTFLQRLEQKHFDDLLIIFDFSNIFQKLMHFFKYEGFLVLADYFSYSILDGINQNYDLITCVPLHPSKQKERGFNQSEVLSKKVNALSGIKYTAALKRIRYTKSQTKLSRSERKNNMMNAFSIQADVNGKSILLIDDVITTGATLNECARILKVAGAKKVDVIALATPVDILQSKKDIVEL